MTRAVDIADAGHTIKAWVNFDGTGGSANKYGAYSQSGTNVMTFTFSTDHDLVVGNVITIGFSSGAASQETFTVATVPSSTVMTATTSAGVRTTSGNFNSPQGAYYQPIRSSLNVGSISENGSGDYSVNFTNPMPDANYCTIVTIGNFGSAVMHVKTDTSYDPITYSTSSVRLATNVGFDPKVVCVAIFGY